MKLVDTSIVVAAVTRERRTAAAQAWLRQSASLFTARWTLVEAMSALSIKARTKEVTPDERDRAAAHVRNLLHSVVKMVELTPQQLIVAAGWCEQANLGLRGPDALHLAIASDLRFSLWTLDMRMVEAGQALGLDVRLLGEDAP